MKLIEQVVLVYQEGRTEKVYEVDLCEVAPSRYVVNFRYGRKGSQLKHGSKTLSSVPMAEARTAYDRLIADKIEQGYRRETGAQASLPTVGATPAATAPTTRAPGPDAPQKPAASPPASPVGSRPAANLAADQEARRRAVLNRLFIDQSWKPRKKRWPLERAIWRVGELRLAEAVPRLIDFLNGTIVRDYSVAWALGRCGDPSAIPCLQQLRQNSIHPGVVSIASEALLKLLDPAGQERLRQERLQSLPEAYRQALKQNQPETLRSLLAEGLTSKRREAAACLETLYFLDSPVARPVVLDVLRQVPLEFGLFHGSRTIFKAAEYRLDAQVYGLLAHRFEKTRPAFHGSRGTRNAPTPNRAYGSKTRAYLRRRVTRALRHLGQMGDLDYVKMAVGVLLPFTDADAAIPFQRHKRVQTSAQNSPRNRRSFFQRITVHWDAYASFGAFNFILYRNSPRYVPTSSGLAWQCKAPYQPGDVAPEAREEAYPELWERRPEGLLHLLAESRCAPVHAFAVKALRACHGFLARLDASVVTLLLGRPYEVTAQFATELAQSLYDPARPDLRLLAALALCSWQPGRKLAYAWIPAQARALAGDTEFLASLALHPEPDARAFLRQLLSQVSLSDAQAKPLLARLLLALKQPGQPKALADDLAVTLRHGFWSLLGRDQDLLLELLAAESQPVRTLGMEILTRRALPELLKNASLLLQLATHPAEDVRKSLLESIQAKLSVREVQQALRSMPEAVFWKLLESNVREAHSVAELSLQHRPAESFSLEQLARLANQESLTARQRAWSLLQQDPARLRREAAATLKLLDTRWDDSRQVAFQLIRTALTVTELTPEVLVALCDSLRDDIQRFGQEMITRHFQEEAGPEILLKLSEHPAPAMELFTTNFLESHAAGHPQRIQKLTPYFTQVLSRVNRNRLAKSRVLTFLGVESRKDEASARSVAEVLTRNSATGSVGYRASSIEGLVRIHQTYPEIPMPFRVVPPPLRAREP